MIIHKQAVSHRPPIRGENAYGERKAKIQERVKRSKQVEFCLTQCPHCDNPCKGTCAEFKAYIKVRRVADV